MFSYKNFSWVYKAKFWRTQKGELHWHNPVSDKVEVFHPDNPDSGKGPHEEVTHEEEASRLWEEKGTDSPFFKRWFAGSKVVDKEGKPLKVFKGYYPKDTETGKPLTVMQRPSEFPAFHHGEAGVRLSGFFSSDRQVAERFGRGISRDSVVGEFYLNFQNPYIIDAKGKKAGKIQFEGSGKEFRDAVRSGKYDGVVIRNTEDEGDVFVALRPEQIKSAKNAGTFSDSPEFAK